MKNLSVKILIFVLVILVFLLGFNYFKKPFAEKFAQLEKQRQQQAELLSAGELSPTPTINPIPDFWQGLSPRERILQVIAMPFLIESSDSKLNKDQLLWLKSNSVGLITFFGQNVDFNQAKDTITAIKQQAQTQKFTPLLAVDHEGGKVQRFNGEGFSVLPSFKTVCQTQEATQAAQLYQQSAQELADVGINIIFAPVIDLADPGTALAERSCSSDPEITTDFAIQSILAYAKSGIMSVIKHFPGMGLAKKDVHLVQETVNLRQKDSEIFKTILDEVPNIGVMTAHVSLKGAIDEPCSLSETCLAKLQETYPEALVFTDALDMAGVLQALDEDELISLDLESSAEAKLNFDKDDVRLASVAKQAILAGNDVLVFGKGVEVTQLDKLVTLLTLEYQKDQNFAAKLDAAGQKILDLKK